MTLIDLLILAATITVAIPALVVAVIVGFNLGLKLGEWSERWWPL